MTADSEYVDFQPKWPNPHLVERLDDLLLVNNKPSCKARTPVDPQRIQIIAFLIEFLEGVVADAYNETITRSNAELKQGLEQGILQEPPEEFYTAPAEDGLFGNDHC